MIINYILTTLVIAAIVAVGAIYYKKLKTQSWEDDFETTYALDVLTRMVAETFATILKQNLKELNMSRVQLEQQEKKKAELRNALKEAAYGNKNSKNFVIHYIRDMLLTPGKTHLSELNINQVIHFDTPDDLKPREKFEIIMHMYRKIYDDDCFTKIIDDYNLLRPLYGVEGTYHFEITTEDINYVYSDVIRRMPLTYTDKIEIVASRIFADYKGFGAADVLFNTTIDEIDGGVSGIPKDSYDIKESDIRNAEFSYESIWVMVRGINIKMSCLSFGTQDELVRVCQNIYKFNAPGALSKRNGYIVSTMKDGSRIVVARPPFCESWCFFARKFDSAPSQLPQDLLIDQNNIIPITLMRWFIKGYRTIAITGSQGTGKTTTLKSMIRFIPEDLNLRIQEMAFELNLRYTYPKRNIVTFQETDSITAQDGLNLQKKTNGSVNIIGEVASADAASWIIQTAMVASLYTMFTHHAKTAQDLIIAIRNNLLEMGGYANEKAAEEMVSRVLNIDMHMEKMNGHRFCSRITEIVPIRDRRYPSELTRAMAQANTMSPNGNYICTTPIEKLLQEDTMEYFKRSTDRQAFVTVNLCEWRDGMYVMTHMPSEEIINDIKIVLSEDERAEFDRDLEMLKGYMVAE